MLSEAKFAKSFLRPSATSAGMKDFRALIFDVDGTMAETEELHRQAFNESFAKFGLDWAWDIDLYGELLRITGGKERISHFLSQYRDDKAQLSAMQIGELHRMKNRRYADLLGDGCCQLRTGIADALEVAKQRGQLLGIATTTSRSNVEALLAPILGRNWHDVFHAIVCGENVPRKKPAPDAYFKVIVDLGLPALACLAFEDSRNGLLAASSAGVRVVILRSMYFGEDDFEGALEVVNELTDLSGF
jgi:HAD superfamily hydrolase (TIGR01509 family)